LLKPRYNLGFGDPVLRIIPVPDRDLARSYGADHDAPGLPGPRREAISASGALNRPRRNSGSTTASTASSLSDGASRKQMPEVWVSACVFRWKWTVWPDESEQGVRSNLNGLFGSLNTLRALLNAAWGSPSPSTYLL
jgi:hypothetical protein